MKNKILATTLSAALFSVTMAPAIFAADEVKTETPSSTAQATADARFMDDVTRGGLMEIEAAKIAGDKTKRDDVKGFAKAMETDHTDVNRNLKTLADRMEMKLPTTVGDHQAFIDGLKAKTDSDFDRTYVAASVESHRKCIAMFEKFWGATQNTDLKAFAANTLPGLRTHLKNAEVLLATLGGPNNTSSK